MKYVHSKRNSNHFFQNRDVEEHSEEFVILLCVCVCLLEGWLWVTLVDTGSWSHSKSLDSDRFLWDLPLRRHPSQGYGDRLEGSPAGSSTNASEVTLKYHTSAQSFQQACHASTTQSQRSHHTLSAEVTNKANLNPLPDEIAVYSSSSPQTQTICSSRQTYRRLHIERIIFYTLFDPQC